MHPFPFSRPTRRPARGLRPRLELLEERALPARLNSLGLSALLDPAPLRGPAEPPRSAGPGAAGGLQVINQPDAGYQASTTRIPITAPNFTPVSSLSDGNLTVTFSSTGEARTVAPGGGWASWSSPPEAEESNPRLIFTGVNVNSQTFTFSQPLSTFGVEVEPNVFNIFSVTATFLNAGGGEIGRITRDVDGRGGARLFAGRSSGELIARVVVAIDPAAMGFGFAQVRYNTAPVIPPAGPVIVDYQPRVVADAVSSIRVLFDRVINPATFTVDDITDFTGQLGPIQATSVVPVPGSLNTRFDINFPLQVVTGLYGMAIGPNIADADGNLMDQNNDGVLGTFDDRFLAIFAIEGARVTAATAGPLGAPVDRIRATFNRAMDPSTFADWVVIDTPSGRIGATGAQAVPGSDGRQIDIFFAPQTEQGTYAYTVGAGVRDVFGNPLDQNRNLIGGEIPADNFFGSFRVLPAGCFNGPDGFGYFSCTAAFENLNLEPGQPGVFNILDATDDGFAEVNLGGRTFNFYGQTFGTLFASSNGLITFGTGNPDFVNADLTVSPPQRAIAALWDDWIKDSGVMILGMFDGDRLIIEWNGVRHFGAANANVTFQVILQLNTGAAPGAITVNYVDLNANDPLFSDGRDATVGIKDVGNQGPNRLLVSFNMLNPNVRSGQAIVFTAMPGGAPSGGSGSGAVLTALQAGRREAAAVVEMSSLEAASVDHLFRGMELFGLGRAEEEAVGGGALREVAEGASLFDLVL